MCDIHWQIFLLNIKNLNSSLGNSFQNINLCISFKIKEMWHFSDRNNSSYKRKSVIFNMPEDVKNTASLPPSLGTTCSVIHNVSTYEVPLQLYLYL